MTTEIKSNVPDNGEGKDKEMKEDAPADNSQTKEEAPAAEKTEEKAEKAEVKNAAPTTVHKSNFEKDVVYLYQFARTPVLPSTSPYCLKVETWLRLAGIKYENVEHHVRFRSKKGQLPFVELNGQEIADSAFIIKDLSEKFNKDLDASLTAEQRVVSHAMSSMIENHLSWVILWWRAKYPESVLKGYHVNLKKALNTRLPNSILNYCFKLNSSRKGLMKAKAHGIGVHSQEEIIEMGKADLHALSELLADKPFLFGDEPTLLDVIAFANLAQLHFLDKEMSNPLRDAMQEKYQNLVGLVERMRERSFANWDEICLPEQPTPPKKDVKETKESKEADAPAEKQPLPEAEKGKGDEKELEKEKKPEINEEKKTEAKDEK